MYSETKGLTMLLYFFFFICCTGWGFFSSYPGGIPYDRCKVEVSSGGNIYKLTSSPLSVNETKAFSLIYSQDVDATCHVYSLAVKVGPVPSGP